MTAANFHVKLPYPSHLIQFSKFKMYILMRHLRIYTDIFLSHTAGKKRLSIALTRDCKQRDRCLNFKTSCLC